MARVKQEIIRDNLGHVVGMRRDHGNGIVTYHNPNNGNQIGYYFKRMDYTTDDKGYRKTSGDTGYRNPY